MIPLYTENHRKIIAMRPLLSAVLFFSSSAIAELDSTRTIFMDSLETVLRNDYRHCTNDSADISIKQLLDWRKSIDSVITSSDYPALTRKFQLETGISPATARPCEIVQWLRDFEIQLQQYTEVLDNAQTQILKERDDSLYLSSQLGSVTKASHDFLDIPFGISRRAFMMIVHEKKLPDPIDEGTFIRFDSLQYGEMAFKIAFHFTKDDQYYTYEIESGTCGFDSLDLWARPTMLYMAAQFEIKLAKPPDHLYRIGLFDIVPGRLSICKLWNLSDATAYFGLARKANRFYAKAIIQRNK